MSYLDTVFNVNSNSYTFNNLNAGEYLDVTVQLESDTNYIDSIQIFTREVFPITNFKFQINQVLRGNKIYDDGEKWTDLDSNSIWDPGEEFIDKKYKRYHRSLNWIPSKETNDNFKEYIIYRAENPEELIDTDSCECAISSLISIIDSSYIDSSIEVIDKQGIAAFFYRIQVATPKAYRNSYIYNYTNLSLPTNNQLFSDDSSSYDGYIIIRWKPIIDTNFDHYEIWRSDNEEISDTLFIINIIDPKIDHFMDRDIGNGTTWFYSLAVVDVNGRKIFSNFIEKWSNP